MSIDIEGLTMVEKAEHYLLKLDDLEYGEGYKYYIDIAQTYAALAQAEAQDEIAYQLARMQETIELK